MLCSVETAYLGIVREVAMYAVANNVTSATQLHKLFYNKCRRKYQDLNSQLIIQAIKQTAEVVKSFVERKKKGLAYKPYPEVKAVSIRFVETTWNYEQFTDSTAPVRLELSLPGGRREVWLRLHKRFWQYWWRVLTGEAELAGTLIVKRKANKWYAIFIFEIKPRQEVPQSVVAFDINENTVAVGKIDLPSTVDRVVDWNRQYLTPELYTIRTDFGRLAKRYERIRNAIIERLKPGFALSSGNYVNITNTREYKKFVRKLREGNRKLGRVRQIANELTRTPAIIVTEDLGERPQDEMISDLESRGLRHRIKQTPFKAVERAVEGKALERGSKLVRVSSYRNSRVCPIHFTRLEETNDWHVLKCPLGHYVDRDYASVINMNWKLTPEAWIKAFWWNMKKNMNWREYEGKSNPIIPKYIIQHLYAILKTLMASEEWPAVLARAKPMNPTGEADEGGGEETSHALSGRGGGQKNLIGVETNSPCLMNLEPTEHSQ